MKSTTHGIIKMKCVYGCRARIVDYLEKQVGIPVIDRPIINLVKDEQCRFEILFQADFQLSRGLSDGQGIDDVHCRSEHNGVTAQTGLITF